MIESKYGLRYSFPHSIVHIVDNSAYTGELPTVIAQDPSLYTTMVVSALPMGEDNKFIKVTRSDIANAAFGLYSLTTADREKFGQGVDYVSSIINQGVPVNLMRVTPSDSRYGYASIVVQWRWDADEHKMHVRYKVKQDELYDIPEDITKKQLNDKLISIYKNDEIVDEDDPTIIWKQRVFINIISAGRGKVYNNMTFAINPVSQIKRPANTRYQFITIDSRKAAPIETYYASLINVDNGRTDAIETSNIQVGKRTAGSSILVPYVNESAIKELWNQYYTAFGIEVENLPNDNPDKIKYKFMNINIFDAIYGKYIYDGGLDVNLPYYQVDMLDNSIPRLDSAYIVNTTQTKFDENPANPEVLQNKLIDNSVGLKSATDPYHIGDIYLTTASGNSNPRLVLTTMINQYTGSITNVTIKQIHPLSDATTVDTTNSVAIKKVFADEKKLELAISKGDIVPGDIVAVDKVNTFALYTITATGKLEYDKTLIYKALDLNSTTSVTGVSNIISTTDDRDSAWWKIGGTRLDQTAGKIYINGYKTKYSASDPVNDTIESVYGAIKRGNAPATTSVYNNAGDMYDVRVYENDATYKFTKNDVTFDVAAGSGEHLAANDIVNIQDGSTLKARLCFKVKSITNTTATVTLISDKCKIAEPTVFAADSTATSYKLLTAEPEDWSTNYTSYYTFTDANGFTAVTGDSAPTWTADTYYSANADTVTLNTAITVDDYTYSFDGTPTRIERYHVAGIAGSLFRVTDDREIPSNYYSDAIGDNITSEHGGVQIKNGSTGFLDDDTIDPIVFKWKYSAMLVKAFRGQKPYDPRIMSPKRVPAFHLFDAGTNTITGMTITDGVTYTPSELIQGSTIFTAEEKDQIIIDDSIVADLTDQDIDVKQAMYDLMVWRNFQGIPEDKRPIGDGSGLSLYLDTGVVDSTTMLAINNSFSRRFTNYNCSWDIGGVYDSETGLPYTYTKRLVDNLFTHCLRYGVNKPFTGPYTSIPSTEFTESFPDIDATEWDMRELLYNSGGNAWILDENNNLTRQSQRTLKTDEATSDLIQESNVRTLSQLVYILQTTIDKWLLQYADDGVIQTLSDEVNNKFSSWVGNQVSSLKITFTKDLNIDGGDILRCDVAVAFRGLILRVPIIVNINRRDI